jgi:hypothetical protein
MQPLPPIDNAIENRDDMQVNEFGVSSFAVEGATPDSSLTPVTKASVFLSVLYCPIHLSHQLHDEAYREVLSSFCFCFLSS